MDNGNLLGKLPNKLPLPDGNWIPQSTSEQTEAETYESHMKIAAINRTSESRLNRTDRMCESLMQIAANNHSQQSRTLIAARNRAI